MLLGGDRKSTRRSTAFLRGQSIVPGRIGQPETPLAKLITSPQSSRVLTQPSFPHAVHLR